MLVHERRQGIENGRRRVALLPDLPLYLLNRTQGEAPREDRESPVECLLGGREEIVGPGDRITKSLMSYWQISRSTSQQGQLMLEPPQECRRRQHAAPRGRQLDGQWQPVQTTADCHDVRHVLVAENESGRLRPHTLDEEGDCWPLLELVQIGSALEIG